MQLLKEIIYNYWCCSSPPISWTTCGNGCTSCRRELSLTPVSVAPIKMVDSNNSSHNHSSQNRTRRNQMKSFMKIQKVNSVISIADTHTHTYTCTHTFTHTHTFLGKSHSLIETSHKTLFCWFYLLYQLYL